MRKIIAGHLYNTETAQRVASSGGCLSNFYETCETLYRTRSGAWFLHGESSAGGAYGRSSEGGNTLSGGDAIVLMSPQDVCDWASSSRLTDDEATTIAALLGLKEA